MPTLALESANAAFSRIDVEREECQQELVGVRKVAEALLRAVGTLIHRAQPDTRQRLAALRIACSTSNTGTR